jgi:hypothetical protein
VSPIVSGLPPVDRAFQTLGLSTQSGDLSEVAIDPLVEVAVEGSVSESSSVYRVRQRGRGQCNYSSPNEHRTSRNWSMKGGRRISGDELGYEREGGKGSC